MHQFLKSYQVFIILDRINQVENCCSNPEKRHGRGQVLLLRQNLGPGRLGDCGQIKYSIRYASVFSFVSEGNNSMSSGFVMSIKFNELK